MQVVVITGGIASGKTRAAQWLTEVLSSLGVISFSADACVHRNYEKPSIRREIAQRLGLSSGWGESKSPVILRSEIRSMAMANPEVIRVLEELMHPLVWSEFETVVSHSSPTANKLLLAEIPLYYETGGRIVADIVVVVAASKSTQLQRLQLVRSIDRSEAERLISLQLPLNNKITCADIVVWNDGALDGMLAQLRLLVEMIDEQNK